MPLIGHTILVTIPRRGVDQRGKRRKPAKFLHYVVEARPSEARKLARKEHAGRGARDVRTKIVKTLQGNRIGLVPLQPGQVTVGIQIQ